MEADSAEPIEIWASRWQDLADFEIIPVLTSQQFWAEFDEDDVSTKKPVRRTGPVFALR